jgi:Alpha-2-macroglobulin bait region domain
LNQKVQFQVGCQDKLTKLSYYIVGRGQVLVSQVVDMAAKNMGVFEFDSILTMAPSSSLVVYFVADSGEIFSDETEFTFEPDVLANPVSWGINQSMICLEGH